MVPPLPCAAACLTKDPELLRSWDWSSTRPPHLCPALTLTPTGLTCTSPRIPNTVPQDQVTPDFQMTGSTPQGPAPCTVSRADALLLTHLECRPHPGPGSGW